METPHSALENALRRAVSLDAEELMFLSGVGAFVTTAVGQLPLPMSRQLSAQRVRELHVACLAVAARDDLKWLHYARYWMTFPDVGKFLCEYVEQRGTNNLRLRREPEERDWVETKHTPELPRQAARALPRPEPRRAEEVDSFVHADSSDDEPRDTARGSRLQGVP
jgi:hypothetical protein